MTAYNSLKAAHLELDNKRCKQANTQSMQHCKLVVDDSVHECLISYIEHTVPLGSLVQGRGMAKMCTLMFLCTTSVYQH
jgi:hypothetical protein